MLQFIGLQRSGHDLANKQHGKRIRKKNRSPFMYSECPPHKHASCEISKMRMCVSMSNLCKLVHMSGIHCHVCAYSTTGCSFLYLTGQYCIEYSGIGSLSQSRMSGSKHKSSGDISGTANKCQELEAQRKKQRRERRSNSKAEEIHNAGNGKGILFEEVLFVCRHRTLMWIST